MKEKINSLTGLRFIAALMVLLHHAFPDFWPFYFSGKNGVTIFFTLSGFVICNSYFDTLQQNFKTNLKTYFLSRFARIYPLYFLILMAAIVENYQALPQILPLQLTLTQAWFINTTWATSYNPVAWSLSVEIFLYLSFPFLVVPLFKRYKSGFGMLLFTSFIFASTSLFTVLTQLANSNGSIVNGVSEHTFEFIYYNPYPNFASFLMGCFAARIYAQRKLITLNFQKKVRASITLLTCIIAVLFFMFFPGLPILNQGSFSSPFYALIIYIFARYRLVFLTFFDTRIFILLGESSFALYLIHYMVLDFLRPIFLTNLNSPVEIFVNFNLVLAINISMAILLFWGFERPMRRLILTRHKLASEKKEQVKLEPLEITNSN